MKTSDSIEQQEERKAARDNADNGPSSRANTPPASQKSKQRDATRIASWRWAAGQSGNPSGRPKKDWASYIAQEAFQKNPELVYRGLVKSLSKGSGFVFQVAADRAYGKIKEQIEIGGSLALGERLEKARKRRAERSEKK